MAVNQFQRDDHVKARVTIGDIAPGTPGTVVRVVLGVFNWYEVQFNGVHRRRYVRDDWLEPAPAEQPLNASRCPERQRTASEKCR